MKLLEGIIFGVDLFNGLLWFSLLTLTFRGFDLPAPHGFELYIALCVAALASIAPDLDMIPYLLIMKRKSIMLPLLAIMGGAVGIALWLLTNKSSPIGVCGLGMFGLGVAWAVAQRVRDRASHWPIWHHPLPFIAIGAVMVSMLSRDFAPAHFWYYQMLVVTLLIAHFLHDGIQPQGFPFLSPFTEAHYRLGSGRVPRGIVAEHYRQQAERAKSRSSKEDTEWRADTVTPLRISLLTFAGYVALTVLLYS